ncbi:hypothetical protein ACXPWS_20620 [Mycobacterium sp. BMJ-28]
MTDSVTYHPDDFSVDDLVGAVHGRSGALTPQVAVALLRAKLGDGALDTLTSVAQDTALDRRVRSAAVRELASFDVARGTLQELATSADVLVAEAAVNALQR